MSTITLAPTLEDQAEVALRRMHISGKLKGLKYLVYTVTETALDPGRTRMITKDLYRETARKFKVTPASVERNIRTAIEIAWAEGGEELDRIAGYHMTRRPSNSEFIDLVAYYIRQNG